jgi:hypothetical protein
MKRPNHASVNLIWGIGFLHSGGKEVVADPVLGN